MNFVICAGYKYTDIDVLASSLALKNLMDLCGKSSAVHLTGPLNATIPRTCKYWNTPEVITTLPSKGKNTHFVIVDISNPYHFEKFVEIEKVSTVYDHHYGYEEFWKNLIGDKAKIEPVGACATLIWEEFKAHNLCHRISSSAANLLYTAIVSNTLNFKAQVTSARDERAASEVLNFITLPKNWVTQYYQAVATSLFQDIYGLIQKDTKEVILSNSSFHFSQLEVWNGKKLLDQYNFFNVMEKIFGGNSWLLSLISIEEGHNYIFTNSEILKNHVRNAVSIIKEGDFLQTEKLWMRKEIIKLLSPFNDKKNIDKPLPPLPKSGKQEPYS